MFPNHKISDLSTLLSIWICSFRIKHFKGKHLNYDGYRLQRLSREYSLKLCVFLLFTPLTWYGGYLQNNFSYIYVTNIVCWSIIQSIFMYLLQKRIVMIHIWTVCVKCLLFIHVVMIQLHCDWNLLLQKRKKKIEFRCSTDLNF